MRYWIFASIIFLAGCAKSSNDSIATYVQVGDRFHIKLTGQRKNMAHDPISVLVAGTSPITEVLSVPRINGRVAGAEIPVKEGYFAYLGEISFDGPRMTIALSYNDTDVKQQRTSGWNGTYELRKSNE
jgi:hypothetical protein